MSRPTPPASASPHGLAALPSTSTSLPIAGRDAELALLAAALQEAQAGRGATLILSGESGIGKTRLATTTVDQAMRRGFTVAVGRAYPVETGVPYAVFADALVPVLRTIEPSSLALLSRGGIGELVQLFPSLASDGRGGATASAPRGDPAELKARLLWNFTQFLSRFSAKRPLLLVLENLQWADSSSLELLHFTARQLGSERILLLGTYNDAMERGADPRSTLRSMESSLVALGAARPLHLTPLDAGATLELVQRGLPHAAAYATELADIVFQRTRGNPFFVEETLKALVESGDAQVRPLDDVRALELPRTIRDALVTRLATLSPNARRLADLVAVIGTRASHDVLSVVSGSSEEGLLGALEELRRARVLAERSDGGTIMYDFNHPLLQETLYAELGLARARALHGSIAESLEGFYGAHASEHVDELAFHYLRADARRLAEKAVQYLRAAGTRAMAKHANREAADYLTAAGDLHARFTADEGSGAALADELGVAITEELARARQRLGEYDAALALWERGARYASAHGQQSRLATIRRNMGLACFWSGRHEDALVHYDAAIAAADAAGAPAVEARTLVAKGMCLQGIGRRDDAEQAVHRALAIAEGLGDAALLARVHRALLLLYVWTGPPEKAREHGQRAIALAEQSGQRGVAWSAHWALAMLAGLTANASDVSEHLSEAQRIADELRSPLLRVWTAEVAIEYHAGIGDWDTAVSLAERSVAVARALGQRTLVPRVLVWLGLLYFGRGEIERGKACVDEAWELCGAARNGKPHAAGDVHSVVPAHTGRAMYHLMMQQYGAAVRIGEHGLEIADASGYVVWAIHRLMPVVAEAALWMSDMDRARRLAARMRRDSQRMGHRLGLAWADACEALVELLQGDKHRSVEMLRGVAEQLEAVPYVPDAARVRRQLARALAETGDREGATRELRRAHEVFARLGAVPELDATREQLRELGARPPARSAVSGAAGLTGRELEIVRLVAARRSNKEIGTALDISSRTVSTHLSNIFGKLAVASRGELADFARKAGLLNET